MKIPFDNFGQWLRYTRQSIGMSAEDVGYVAGYNRNYILMIEEGHNKPSLRAMENISNALNYNMTLSLERKGECSE